LPLDDYPVRFAGGLLGPGAGVVVGSAEDDGGEAPDSVVGNAGVGIRAAQPTAGVEVLDEKELMGTEMGALTNCEACFCIGAVASPGCRGELGNHGPGSLGGGGKGEDDRQADDE